MKKTLLLSCLALAFAATGCKNGKNAAAGSADSTGTYQASSQIAYFDLDSLVSGYNLYLDLRTQYEEKATKVQNELNSKGRALERDVASFQEKAQKGLATRYELAEMEESLGRRQQTFMQSRETMLRDLAEEEQVMLNRIHYNITEFLKEFNADYRYGMILSTQSGGPVMHADPALDITKVIQAGLNKKYAAEKATEKPAK